MSPIRRVLTSVALALLLAGLGACMQSEQKTVLKKDGSGRVTMTIKLETGKLKQLEEMMEGFGAEAGGPDVGSLSEEFDPETLKKIAAANKNIRVISVESKENEAKTETTYTAVFEFDDLESLYKSGLITGADVKLEKQEDGNYRFVFEVGAGQGIENVPDDPEMQEQVEMMLAMFEPFVGSLKVESSLVLPTPIVETNGERAVGNEVRWSAGFRDLLKSENRRQTVTFSGEGLDWKPFTIDTAAMQKAREQALEKAMEEAMEKAKEEAGKTPAAPAPAR